MKHDEVDFIGDDKMSELCLEAVRLYYESARGAQEFDHEAPGVAYSDGWKDGFRTAEIYHAVSKEFAEAMKKEVRSHVLNADLKMLIKVKASRMIPDIIKKVSSKAG